MRKLSWPVVENGIVPLPSPYGPPCPPQCGAPWPLGKPLALPCCTSSCKVLRAVTTHRSLASPATFWQSRGVRLYKPGSRKTYDTPPDQLRYNGRLPNTGQQARRTGPATTLPCVPTYMVPGHRHSCLSLKLPMGPPNTAVRTFGRYLVTALGPRSPGPHLLAAQFSRARCRGGASGQTTSIRIMADDQEVPCPKPPVKSPFCILTHVTLSGRCFPGPRPSYD